MSTETTPGTPETEQAERATQEEQATGQPPAGEPPATDEAQNPTPPEEIKLPGDHPLVTAYEAQKAEIKALKSQVSQYEKANEPDPEIEQIRKKADTVDSVQQKYSRLEEFLIKAGGPLGKALDSRSFTKALFESDDDIDTIVADWNRNNPTATSQALGSGAGSSGTGKPSMNDLLRSAAK